MVALFQDATPIRGFNGLRHGRPQRSERPWRHDGKIADVKSYNPENGVCMVSVKEKDMREPLCALRWSLLP